MKILLTAINAKYIHSNLAVYSLQAYAAAHGHKIERAEYTINNQLEASPSYEYSLSSHDKS